MKKLYKKSSNISQGVFWATITCFLVSVIISIVRYLSKDMTVSQIIMMRNFFALFFLIPFIIKNISIITKAKDIRLHLIRGLNGLVSMFVWFYAVTKIPLPEAVSITFIVPILTTLGAMIFLKEKVSKKIWLSLFIGFVGILMIIRPGFKEWNNAYFFAILAPFLWSISNLLVKKMVATEKPESIAFYLSAIMLMASIPVAAPSFQPISLVNLGWLALVGLLSNFSYIATSISYSKTDLSKLQPFDFSRLIFAAIIAYFAFGEVIDIWTIYGSVIILLSSLYLTPKERPSIKSIKKIFSKKRAIPQSQIGTDL